MSLRKTILLTTIADTNLIPPWSRGAVNKVVQSGFLVGYSDNTFRPQKLLSRAEAIVALDSYLGFSLKNKVFDESGQYGEEEASSNIDGNVVVSARDVTLRNMTVRGNLTITESVGDGSVYLENITVKGITHIRGGGNNSVHFVDSTTGRITVDKYDGRVRLVAEGTTNLGEVILESGAMLEEANLSGEGFGSIYIFETQEADSRIILAGKFDSVIVNELENELRLEITSGSVNNLNVGRAGIGPNLDVSRGAAVYMLKLDAKSNITGEGVIEAAQVNVSGSTFRLLPDSIQKPDNVVIVVVSGIRDSGGGRVGDSTPPTAPVVSGVSEGQIAPSLTPYWTDEVGTTSTATLDGNPYSVGTTVYSEGFHTLRVTAKKTANGLTATTVINFTIRQDGTQDYPFLIFTPEDLFAVRGNVAGYTYWGLGKSYLLMNNIDLSGYGSGCGWEPLGNNSTPFTGSLEGNGYEITNLFINRPTEMDQGLFGKISNAEIRNVGLVNTTVYGESTVGGLAGYSTGSSLISGCYLTGTGSINGEWDAGGLIGLNGAYSQIEGCYTVVNVNGDVGVGGMAGCSLGSISDSFAKGNIVGNDSVGGLIGYTNNASAIITNCYAVGNVTGIKLVGGLIGYNGNGSVERSYAEGDITGNNNVGGLIGSGNGEVTNSFAVGKVTGTDNSWSIGGLTGRFDGIINGSHATGIVKGFESIGGLVGYAYGSITDSYAIGNVTGSGDKIGGLAGEIRRGTTSNSFAEGNVSGNNSVGGLAGLLAGGNIINSYATGSATSTGDWIGGLVGYSISPIVASYSEGNVSGRHYVGGLVGYNDNGTIGTSHATGNVEGTGYIGGLVGYVVQGTISDCYSEGSVFGSGMAPVGGIVGVNQNPGIIIRSYARGDMTGQFSVGGLVGTNYGSISSSFAFNNIVTRSSGTWSNFGRVVASPSGGNLSNNYANSSMVYKEFPAEEGTTSFPAMTIASDGKDGADINLEQAAQEVTYIDAGWDMDTIWQIDTASGYPRLRGQ